MSYEPTVAEIVTDDSDIEDVVLWPKNTIDDIQSQNKYLGEELKSLQYDVKPGLRTGVSEVLQNKGEFDPGHHHMFLPKDITIVQSFFESTTGWSTGGVGTEVITPKIGGISIATGASSADDAWILGATTGFNSFDVSQLSVFQSVLKFSSATAITGYWGVGDITAGGAFGGANEEGYGFKNVNGTLSALTVKDGTETLTTISGITTTNFNEYRAIFNRNKVIFFVNNKIVATHTAGIPDTDDDIFATFYVKTTAAGAKTMYAKYLYFVQQNT